MAKHGPWKMSLDFGANADRITLGLAGGYGQMEDKIVISPVM